MNIKKLLLLLMVMGFAVGCTSTPEEDEGELATAQLSVFEPTGQDNEESAVISGYKVARGDNLWDISAQEGIYGNPYKWPLIYKANRDQISDADLIYPEQEFSIIHGMSEDIVEAAVSHAKNRGAWSLGEVEATDRTYLNE